MNLLNASFMILLFLIQLFIRVTAHHFNYVSMLILMFLQGMLQFELLSACYAL